MFSNLISQIKMMNFNSIAICTAQAFFGLIIEWIIGNSESLFNIPQQFVRKIRQNVLIQILKFDSNLTESSPNITLSEFFNEKWVIKFSLSI